MMKKILLLAIVTLILTACGSGSTPIAPPTLTPASNHAGADEVVQVVERYLQAKVAVDQKTVKQLLCSALEAQADQEATTFLGTDSPQIEAMACSQIADDKVKCSGKITALYGQEKNEFPLVTYKVVEEDGEWKYCGETQ